MSGTISEVKVLHYQDERSDKIWGYFTHREDNRDFTYKFWGRRTVKEFQTMVAPWSVIHKDYWSKQKKGYDTASDKIAREVERKLRKQIGIAAVSEITQAEMDRPIRPSEVRQTIEEGNIIRFYCENGILLGVRPFDQRHAIYEHIGKMKIVESSNTLDDGSRVFNWAMKEE